MLSPKHVLPLLFAAIALLTARADCREAADPLLSGPYAIDLRTDGATICWQTVGESAGAVRYKAGDAAEWTEVKEAKATDFHSVRLAGLAAGTLVKVEALSAAGGKPLGELSFRTAPKEAREFTFYVYGDTRSHPDAHARVAAAVAKEAERRKQFTFVLTTGDMANAGSSAAETARQFFTPAEPVLKTMPIIQNRGNHECGTDLFDKYYPAPAHPEASGDAGDVCFDYGSVRIIVLDQYSTPKDQKARLKWVAAKLAEAGERWRIVAFHEPIYSSGSHGANLGFRAKIEPILVAGKVHLVIAGHDHDYERFKPVKGITHIITGGGGAPLRGNMAGRDELSARFAAVNHYLTVAVTPEKLIVRAMGPGEKADEFAEFDSTDIPKDCGWPVDEKEAPRKEPAKVPELVPAQ